MGQACKPEWQQLVWRHCRRPTASRAGCACSVMHCQCTQQVGPAEQSRFQSIIGRVAAECWRYLHKQVLLAPLPPLAGYLSARAYASTVAATVLLAAVVALCVLGGSIACLLPAQEHHSLVASTRQSQPHSKIDFSAKVVSAPYHVNIK